jgi:peptidoglycan/LPS O-acetylase OafA/YrhL
VLGYAMILVFCLANARAARIVGERWGIDTAVALPRVGSIILVDAVVVIVYGAVTGNWAALAVLPLLATVLLVALRWRGGSRPLGVGGRPQSPAA